MSRVTYQISMCRLFAHVRQFVRLFTQTGSLKQFGKLYRQTVRCRDCIKLFGKLYRQTVRCRDCIKLLGPPCKLSANLF